METMPELKKKSEVILLFSGKLMGEKLSGKLLMKDASLSLFLISLSLFLSYVYPVFNDTTDIYSECD